MGGGGVADLAAASGAPSVPSPFEAVMALFFLFIFIEVVDSNTSVYIDFFFFINTEPNGLRGTPI